MQDKVAKIQAGAQKLQSNKWVSALTGSMASLMAVLMTGAIFSLLNGLPLGAWYTNFLANTGLSTLFGAIVDVCNFTAVYMCLAIGYGFAKQHDTEPFQGALLSLLCFFIVTPIGMDHVLEDGSSIFVGGVLNNSWLGAQGIFSAIIVSIAATGIYSVIAKRGWKIKMPEAVPEFVAKPFEAIIPAFLTALPFVAIRAAFMATSFGSFHQFVYSMVATPLLSLGNSFPAHLVALAIACILWWMGIHGTLVVFSAMMMILSVPALENLEAFNAGQPLPHLLSMMTFFVAIQFMGGPGCMFGLYINMLFSKSARYKALGKVAIVPGIFNIIEPVVFGFPIVLNPIMFFPFVLTPLIVYSVMYFLMSVGIVGVPVIMLQVMTLPGPIAGFLLGGGISLGIFLILACALSIVIYFPFFRLADATALKEEKLNLAAKNAETDAPA